MVVLLNHIYTRMYQLGLKESNINPEVGYDHNYANCDSSRSLFMRLFYN
jgi:hypothetical protein